MTKEQVNLAIEDYIGLVKFVDKFEGDFSTLRKELGGIESDFDTFKVVYKSIVAEVYLNLGIYFVSGDLIVFDDEIGEMKNVTISELKDKGKRFELFLYDGAGRGKSLYFDHLEDLLVVAEAFVGDDMEMASQFNAYDHFKNRDISHNIGMYVMEGVETIDNDCYAQCCIAQND